MQRTYVVDMQQQQQQQHKHRQQQHQQQETQEANKQTNFSHLREFISITDNNSKTK